MCFLKLRTTDILASGEPASKSHAMHSAHIRTALAGGMPISLIEQPEQRWRAARPKFTLWVCVALWLLGEGSLRAPRSCLLLVEPRSLCTELFQAGQCSWKPVGCGQWWECKAGAGLLLRWLQPCGLFEGYPGLLL